MRLRSTPFATSRTYVGLALRLLTVVLVLSSTALACWGTFKHGITLNSLPFS